MGRRRALLLGFPVIAVMGILGAVLGTILFPKPAKAVPYCEFRACGTRNGLCFNTDVFMNCNQELGWCWTYSCST
jgi:hypothetical protein